MFFLDKAKRIMTQHDTDTTFELHLKKETFQYYFEWFYSLSLNKNLKKNLKLNELDELQLFFKNSL